MAKIKDIFSALLIFMTGVIFAYYSYPFMNALLTAITDTTGIFSGWETINFIMWAGYIVLVVLWILVWPASRLMQKEGIGDN